MRILFIGAVQFSKSMLSQTISLGVDVVGVVTKKTSLFNADYAEMAPLCRTNKIPIYHTNDINNAETRSWMQKKEPDYIFCFGWSEILRESVLSIARYGVIGYHPAQLPLNRGRHPLIWALCLGLTKTASTFFFMDKGADSGDILSQVEVPIRYGDTAQDLYNRITVVAASQLKKIIPQLQRRTFKTIKQNASKATYWRKRTSKDGEIDFRMSSRAIYNLVRALSKPYPGATLTYNREIIKIWKVREIKSNKPNIEFGKVLKVSSSGVLVKCYDNAVLLERHSFTTLPKPGEYLQ